MLRKRKDNEVIYSLELSGTKMSRQGRKRTPFMIITVIIFAVVVGFYFFTFTSSTLNLDNTESKTNQSVPKYDSSYIRGSSPQGAVDKTYTQSNEVLDSCATFDHGDTTPVAGLDSVFNCNSEYGKCKWYFPARFFDKSCGIGRDYTGHIDILKDLHQKRLLWLDGPPIVLPWASITPDVIAHQFRKEPFPTHNISMTHVHKTGGTSLVLAFSSILNKRAKGKRHLVYQPPRSRAKVQTNTNSTNNRSYNAASSFLNGAVKYRSKWGPYDHTLFAVIRDPAERFISAIGQATGAYGSAGNGIGDQLRQECVKGTTSETLSCFVDLVQNNGTLIEVHFTPMVYEISFATMWKDIPVAVFPFEEVPTLMNELGANPDSKKKDGHAKGKLFELL